MKKLQTLVFALLCVSTLSLAQVPQKFSYQAVIRNPTGVLVSNSIVTMRISIVQTSATGTAVYTETQKVLTNANGLLSLEIGTGTKMNGDFSTIDWGNGPYFIKTETDINGGSDYNLISVSQLLSVPYALHASTSSTAETVKEGKHFIGELYGGGIVFYTYENGLHGLVVALKDVTSFGGSAFYTLQSSTDGIKAGYGNTHYLWTASPLYNGLASIAINYTASQNGVLYADWYLPSKHELNLMYLQKSKISFAPSLYISSTSSSTNSSGGSLNMYGIWHQDFATGTQAESKTNTTMQFMVRPIRAF